MTEHLHGVNTISIAGEPFLLAGGEASHLVAEAQDTEAGRPAVDPSKRWLPCGRFNWLTPPASLSSPPN